MYSISSDLSEVWCSKENEKAILRRTKRAMVRAKCGQKIVDKKTTEEQMNMLGLKETIDRLAAANGLDDTVMCCGGKAIVF